MMLEYRNAYFIPSHRTIEDENLADYANEVYFALKNRNAEIPLIFLDDTDKDINKDKISSLSNEFKEVEFFVLNKLHISQIYNEISKILKKEQREIFSSLYPDDRVNYGNTLNKMFILATVLGCDAFHRRDSDILIDTSKESSQKIYPIEVELDYMGSNMDGKTVYIVGSGYTGVRNIDFEEIIGNDVSLYKEYLDCLNMPEEYQKEKIINFLKSTDEPFCEDKITMNGSPECGNVSFYRIFEYLPCSPVPFTIGTDYFTKEIVNQAGLGLAYHNRNVIHRHTKCRYDNDLKVYNYVKGVASFVDSMFFYSDFFPNMKEEMIKNRSFEDKLPELCDTLVQYYSEKINKMDGNISARKQSFKRFIDLTAKSKSQSFRDAASKLIGEEEAIFNHTDELLNKHVELIKAWSLIIEAAKTARKEAKIQEVLLASKIK